MVDTGASISTIDAKNAKGTKVKGKIKIKGINATASVNVSVGGSMSISEVPDEGAEEPPETRSCELPVAITGNHTLGTDQMAKMKLIFLFNFSTSPPTIGMAFG